MDVKRFDADAKALIAETTRRRTLGALLGGTLVALAEIAADNIASAKSRKCDPKCDECHECTKGRCRKHNGKKACKPARCKPKASGIPCMALTGGAACQKGICSCLDGLTNCNGSCKNLNTDEANCGACGGVCAAGQTCCNGTCSNLNVEANCGSCGNVCAANQVCNEGPFDACRGTCGPTCDFDTQARDPDDCGCCFVSGVPCPHPGMGFPPQPNPNCCSGFCDPFAVNSGVCAQGAISTPCTDNAHCESGTCEDGLCIA